MLIQPINCPVFLKRDKLFCNLVVYVLSYRIQYLVVTTCTLLVDNNVRSADTMINFQMVYI